MNALSRRTFTSLFGIASTAVAVPALASSTTVTGETPEFLALVSEIANAQSRIAAAKSAYAAALQRAKAFAPELPDELIYRRKEHSDYALRMADEATDIAGNTFPGETYVAENGRTYAKSPTYVMTSQKLGELSKELGGRTAYVKILKRLQKIAKQYEAARTEAIRRSGLDIAQSELWLAKDNFDRMASQLAELPAKSSFGREAKARLARAIGSSDKFRDGQLAGQLALSLANDILLVAA